MTLDEYQRKAMATAVDTSGDFVETFMHRVLGLVGESGEVAEKVKKIVRDKHAKIDETDEKEIVKELGDVLWYLAALADYLGVSLQEVADINIGKLASRKVRGKIHGAGDNR
ncbi:MAG TPA: nucleoside triphosphate pyrophosphohydrolase family protein [Candidatus Saccharimonadales bacterium]